MGSSRSRHRGSIFGPSAGGIIKGGNRRRRRRLGRAPRVVVTLLLIYAVIEAGAWALAELKLRGEVAEVQGLKSSSGPPMNVLIVTRAQGPRKVQGILLIHVAGGEKRPIGIHIPPDLRVRLGEDRSGKISDAVEKGPSGMVKAAGDLTKLPIHHYVEVDVTGLGELAADVGGVRLRQVAPGSEVACRSYQEEDLLKAFGGPADDPMAVARREAVAVGAIAEKISRRTFPLVPWRMARTAGGLDAIIDTDAALSLGDVIAMARSISEVDIDLRSIPISEPAARIGGVNYVIANERQTKALLDAVREGGPVPEFGRSAVPTVDRSELTVAVLNGTGVEGLAKKVADQMTSAGFPAPITANAVGHQATTVYFRPGAEQRGKIVAAMFDAAVKPLAPSMSAETDVTVVVGEDLAAGESAFDPTAVPSGVGEPDRRNLAYC